MTTKTILPIVGFGILVSIFCFLLEYKDPFDFDNSESVLYECIILFLSGPTGLNLISALNVYYILAATVHTRNTVR